MRVFVTGASGFIGSAVVAELLGAGHEVVGLARSDDAAAAVAALGADVQRGSLDDLDVLREGALAADGVAHLAFIHDFANFAASVAADLRAVEAIGDALAGSGKPFVNTSGVLGLNPGRLGTESDTPVAPSPAAHRQVSATATLALAERGVRSAVLRLAPSVHGAGDHGFVPRLIEIARERGVSGFVGDGSVRWTAVHRLDAARLYRLALESAPPGSVLHGVAEEAVTGRALAEVIGRQLELPVVSVASADAGEHFGWLGAFLGLDSPASSSRTRALLGWQPVEPGLIDDLEAGHYFDHATTH